MKRTTNRIMRNAVKYFLIIFVFFPFPVSWAQEKIQISTELSPGLIVVSNSGRGTLKSLLNNINDLRDLVIETPDQIRPLISAIETCSTTLAGWDKDKFLSEWTAAHADIDRFAKHILYQSANYRLRSLPLVRSTSFNQPSPAPGQESTEDLSPNVKKFIEEAKKRGVPVEIIHTPGKPGPSIVDQRVLDGDGRVSDEDIIESVSNYISAALPRLYDRFFMTPSACYSSEQSEFVKARLKDTFGSKHILEKRWPGQKTVQIECGTNKSHSRFAAPEQELSPLVLRVLVNGPWPFGPPGYYFSRSWFLRVAIWQMYAREGREWRENLSVDIADYYTCGPP